MAMAATGFEDHATANVELEKERIELLGKMQRFRDQSQAMCTCACNLVLLKRKDEGLRYFQRARDVGAAHGFFSAECNACLGLGDAAIADGRGEEGVDLLRNAMAAARISEDEVGYDVINVLDVLPDALIDMGAIDEAEKLMGEYKEAAMANSRLKGCLTPSEISSLVLSARVHEVRSILVPHGEALHTDRPLHSL
jgi:hypothetical protein